MSCASAKPSGRCKPQRHLCPFGKPYWQVHVASPMNPTKAIRLPGTSPEISRVLLLVVAFLVGPCAAARAQGYIFEELYAFSGDTNGYGPKGALVQGMDGKFYGTCNEGGQPTTNCPACGYGTVFKIAPNGVLTTLAQYHG